MKKQILPVLLALCMMAALWPTAAMAAEAPTVFNDEGKNICANGMPIKIVAGTTAGYTNILYDIDENGTIGDTEYLKIGSADPTAAGYDLSDYRILGGKQSGSFDGDSNITIDGGYVGDVMGGNFSDDLTGNVTIVMNGGSVARILACGYWGKVKGSDKTTSITIRGGTVRGGENDDIELSARNLTEITTLLITGGTVNGTITSTVTPTNGTNPVYKTTLTLMDGETAKANTAVTALTTNAGYTYGMAGVKTDGSGQLAVYLPAGTTVTGATVGTAGYINSTGITVSDDNAAAGILTKAKLLTVTAPSPMTLTNEYASAQGVIDGGELPATVAVTTENSAAVTLPCVWTFSGTYNAAAGAANTFHWAATTTGYAVNGKTVSGDVSVTNKAAPTPPTTTGGGYSGYTFTKGAFGTFKGNGAIELRVDRDYSDFRGVSVDGVQLTRGKDYTVKSGSTIITLAPAYVKTLSKGAHTLYVDYAYGYASTTLYISDTGLSSPKTGDAGMALYAGMALLSSAGVCWMTRKSKGEE